MKLTALSLVFTASTLSACAPEPPLQVPGPTTATPTSTATWTPTSTLSAPENPASKYAGIERSDWNRAAVRLNLPLYWMADKNGNHAVDVDEVKVLLFYGSSTGWVTNGAFTKAFDDAFARIRQSVAAPVPAGGSPDDAERRKLVVEDLDQGAATLVQTDLGYISEGERNAVNHLMTAAVQIDRLYAVQKGVLALERRVPTDDLASQSLFRRNWGPKCAAPKTEKNPACSAIPGAPQPVSNAYPTELQSDPKFCEKLEKEPNAKELLSPFVVVRKVAGKLVPVSFAEAYKDAMRGVSAELTAAADALTDPEEVPFRQYLRAAAASFISNDWLPADEAWAKMNAQNSKWYLRVGPDEVYWDPCNHKAGFHMTLARINAASLTWQEKLNPVRQDMERAMAARIGAPYAERKVTFHLPDFIDIVFTAGDDRNPMGATIGQSLPNWGKVAAEGRGRTVAMSNLYADADSMAYRHKQAESLLVPDTMKVYVDDPTPGFVSTILHEATHNLGPSHEYAYRGKTDAAAFGGSLATMLEELKAQTGGLWYIDYAKTKGIISPELARQTYVDSVVWAFNHIARGMVTDTGERKPYSQLAAIQMGFLLDDGALKFDPNAAAANGTDKGAFAIDFDKFPAAIDRMMKVVGTIKATNDKAAADALANKYVDGNVVPHATITERSLRFPKASFVYAIDM